MSSEVFDLLSDLVKDSGKLAAFNDNPAAVLEKYGINEEMKAVLTGSNWEDGGERVENLVGQYGKLAP